MASMTQSPEFEQFDFFEYGLTHQFGDLHLFMDDKTGMKVVIAIHNTVRGPALGGCRFIHYPHTNAAILDAMRLARGMSYKNAMAGLPLGGGKAVIIEPTTPYDRNAFLSAFGRFVESLGGRYITAPDSGSTVEDMDQISQHTSHVTCLSKQGDPSLYTAQGVFHGIEALVDLILNQTSLAGVRVAIQGLGHVGFKLAEYLHERKAILTVSDTNPAKAQAAQTAFGATVVPPTEIHRTTCDVFAPCALGGILNDETIEQIQAPIVAGAANNQLAHTYHGQHLLDKNIAYAVDYVINAGGILFASHQYYQTESAQMYDSLAHIGSTLVAIVKQSIETRTPTNLIADKLAQERLQP